MTRLAFFATLMLFPAVAMAQRAEPDHCGASGFQGLVGQSAAIAEMLVLDQPKRVIPPGTAVTRDYRNNRINFDVDDNDLIARVYCG